jgi:outer membrane protein
VRAYIWAVASLSLAGAGLGIGCPGAAADTLEWALVQAYQNNPSLNAQRASLRATDESVPQALSGYRPKLSLAATGGYNYQNSTSVFPLAGALITSPFAQNFYSRTIGANGTYTLFNGFQTANRTRQAESQVDAARETLRVTEQQVLLDAATAYMNLLRDQAVLDLQRRNVEVLTEQLKQTRDRFNVGEVTRTDVAQAESRLAAGRSQLLAAQSQYVTSRANYRRVIGVDPGTLAAGTPVDRLSPNVLARAIAQGQAQSPSVLAAADGVDVAELAVKISEGALYPNLTVTGSVLQGQNPAFEVIRLTQLSAVAQLSVPIYQGGGEYSAVRQSKETLGQQRLNLDVNRDQARATVVQSWGQLDAAKAICGASQLSRDRAQRCTRRSARRTANDARRAQRPAGTGERARCAGHRPARSRGRLLHVARGGRCIVDAEARPQHPGLRPDGALPADARRLGGLAQS